MCGIAGYLGPKKASDFLLEALKRLEYRGYDSAGMVTFDQKKQIHCVKTVGKLLI